MRPAIEAGLMLLAGAEKAYMRPVLAGSSTKRITGKMNRYITEASDHSQKQQNDDDQKNQADPAAAVVTNARTQAIAAKAENQQ
jgi:hypothetical protein